MCWNWVVFPGIGVWLWCCCILILLHSAGAWSCGAPSHHITGVCTWGSSCFRGWFFQGQAVTHHTWLLVHPPHVGQQEPHPDLSWAVGHGGWNTEELFFYPLVFLNKFILTKEHAATRFLSLLLSHTATLWTIQHFVLILNFHIFFLVFQVICAEFFWPHLF